MTNGSYGDITYQDKKAIMKPNQEKKNTRPYTVMGLSIGIDRAFLLIGFTAGVAQRREGLKPAIVTFVSPESTTITISEFRCRPSMAELKSEGSQRSEMLLKRSVDYGVFCLHFNA